MDVAHTDILELFVEAAALGGSAERQVRRDLTVRARRVWTVFDAFAEKRRVRAIDRGLRRVRALRAGAMHVADMRDQSVTVHLPPRPGERVRGCACGGYLERRVGMSRLTHIGPRGCRATRAST
jgi:hypothetical protein